MDIARPLEVAERRRRKRVILAVSGVAAVALISLGLSRLKPAAPTVDKATVYIDTVKRGPMVRQVRGPGTLIPEEINWIAAATDGRVEKILVLPGTMVKPNTVLLVLSNPELVQAELDAESQLKAAEADLVDLRVRLESQVMDQKSAAAAVASEYHQASLQLDVDEKLAKDGLVSDLLLNLSRTKAAELKTRSELAEQRLDIASQSVDAQLAAQRARVEQARALERLKRSQVDALHVKAGITGVLQQLPVEVGQRLTAGATLAKVTEPHKLKAELKIAETQAKDVTLGEKAEIDTRNGIVSGHVIRIDPAVQNGTVSVDVAFDAPLPQGARPDLSVDGTIEIERLSDVVYVGRPAFGQEKSTITIFKLVDSGDAVRVPVQLGVGSVNTVQILQGLKPGDRVILSDLSAYDSYDRIRLD
jgi:HlyD family secretion protein